MRMLIDAVGEQPALVEADIAGRRADQARYRVPLHVFRHVKAYQLDAKRHGQLLGNLGLADAGRPGKQVTANRLFRLAQAGARQLDRGRQRIYRLVLAVAHALEGLLEMPEHRGIVLRYGLRRNPRYGGDSGFDLLDADGLLAAALGQQHLRRARLVDHVDRLVGQLAVVDVARRQFDRRLDRLTGVFELVIFLEIGLEPLHDLDGVRNRRLVDVDLLKPAYQRAILLEMLAVFLVGGRADAADGARGERGLEQIGCVHCAARGGASADHGVDLVDEHDRARIGLDLLDHLLEPLLEVAAVAGAGEQRAHVEREHGGALKHIRHLAMHDAARQTFRDRGLADAGIADEQRIILLPAAKHLDGAVDFAVSADQRIDLAVLGLFVEVDTVRVKRVAFLLRLVAALGVGLLLDAAHRARFR